MKETILVVEDNSDDAFLLRRAFERNQIEARLVFVHDGVEGIEYLSGLGKYADRKQFPLPSYLLLDLKMPRMSGIEFLEWLKHEPRFKTLPVLVLTSSNQQVDVQNAYQSGANSYMVKPVRFEDFAGLVRIINEYWKTALKLQHLA